MNILYEDNHIIVAVKPQNVPSQADNSGDMDFLSQIKEYVRVKYNKPGEAYIGLVHRLDRPAGGLMVFARTSKAAARLQKQLMNGSFKKEYYAAMTGNIAPNNTLNGWLVKDEKTNISAVVPKETPGGKYAELSYEIVAQEGGYSLLRINLVTGRAHQIRVQMAHAGAPLVGDRKYGGAQNDYLCLWACALEFTHPVKKEGMGFYCPPPAYSPWVLFEIPHDTVYNRV